MSLILHRPQRAKTEEELKKEIKKLRELIADCTIANAAMEKAALSFSTRNIRMHAQAMKDYGRYFRFGADPTLYGLQLQFLQQFICKSCHMGETYWADGPLDWWHQWLRFKSLYPKMEIRNCIVKVRDFYGDVVSIDWHCVLPVTRPSLVALYPDVLQDEELTQSVITKTIIYEATFVFYFNENHQAEHISWHYNLESAWEKVIGEASSTMIKTCQLEDGLTIGISDEEAERVAQQERIKEEEEPTDEVNDGSSSSEYDDEELLEMMSDDELLMLSDDEEFEARMKAKASPIAASPRDNQVQT